MSGKQIPVQVTWEKVQQLAVYNVETGNKMVITIEGEELNLLSYLPSILQQVGDEYGNEQ